MVETNDVRSRWSSRTSNHPGRHRGADRKPAQGSTSAVQRALAGLRLELPDHAAALAAAAKRHLEAHDGSAGWLVAERLVRMHAALVADDLVLRALSLAVLDEFEGARSDIRDAMAIDPWHTAANRLLLTSAAPAEREQAARRLLHPSRLSPVMRHALQVLSAGDAPVASSLESAPGCIRGWIAWHGAPVLRCRLKSGAVSIEHVVAAQPTHALTGAFTNAATVEWPWPADTDHLTVTCRSSHREARPDRLWRCEDAPAAARPRPANAGERTADCRAAVIVPVFDDLGATQACFAALLSDRDDPVRSRIIAVDDATPDPRIAALLDEMAGCGQVELLRHSENLGFAASVNHALAALRGGEDAVLVNADTIPPPNLCARLARVAYLQADIGTVTPLSNNGEYTSMPVRFRENPLLSPQSLAKLDALAVATGDGEPVELPNGIGFCLYVKRAVLDSVGLLSMQFGRGYGEDIEFCLRAGAAGFRHVCATDVFVGHAGARSFKTEKRSLAVGNLSRIDQLHPSYRRTSAAFVRQDPLRDRVGRLEWRWLLARQAPCALLVCGSDASDAMIGPYAREQRQAGLATIVATLDVTPRGLTIQLRDQAGDFPQNVRLAYEGTDAHQAAICDLARLYIVERAVMDPWDLPQALVQGLTASGTAYDVLLADAQIFRAADASGAPDSVSGSTPEPATSAEGTRSALREGWSARLLAEARRILAPTDRFGRALTAHAPALADRIHVLPDDQPAGPLVRPARSGERGTLLIVCDEPRDADTALVRSLAETLRRTDANAGIVVDGPLAEDLAIMALGNVFVLGRVVGGQSPSCKVPVAAVLFSSRRRGLGDARVDRMRAMCMPVAHFGQVPHQNEADGRDLLLPLDQPASAAVSALLKWWQRLRTAPVRTGPLAG